MRSRKHRPYNGTKPPRKSSGEIDYKDLPPEVREVIERVKRELSRDGYRFEVSTKSPDTR